MHKQENNSDGFPGLSRSQEADLIRTYRKGLIAEEKIKDHLHPSQDLESVVKEGQKAEEILLVNHFPLVKSTALKFYLKNKDCVELEDLVGAGNEGLVIALRKFDVELGFRLSTYAMWWIRNRISYLIRKERWPIHIPDHIYKALTPVMKFVVEFRQEKGRDPILHEIARHFDRPVAVFRKLLSWLDQKEISLSTPVGDDGMSTLEDLIADRSGLNPSEILVRHDLRETIFQVLRTLTPPEENVIKLRFGLETNEKNSQTQIGEAMAINTDTARRIESKALRKLRHPSRMKKLEPFLRLDPEQAHEKQR